MSEVTLPSGRPLAIDSTAKSARTNLPAFLARPNGAPVYHGFRVLHDVAVEGFTLGVITDFEAQESNEGDAFVVAPDTSRAGLVWEFSGEEMFVEVCPMTVNRWGVWEVHFPFAMNSRENARMNLQAILPRLKPKMGAMAASVRAVDSMNRHRARIEPSSAVRLATTPLCASSPSESQCDVH